MKLPAPCWAPCASCPPLPIWIETIGCTRRSASLQLLYQQPGMKEVGAVACLGAEPTKAQAVITLTVFAGGLRMLWA